MCHIKMISKNEILNFSESFKFKIGSNESTFGVVFEHVEHQNCLLYQLTEVYLYQSGNPSNYFDLFRSKYEQGKVETRVNTLEKPLLNIIRPRVLMAVGLSEEP